MNQSILNKLGEFKSLNEQELALLLETLLNGQRSFTSKELPNEIEKFHRYLQSELMEFIVRTIGKFAEMEKQGRYDPRNEWAVKLSAELKPIIDDFVLKD